MAHSVVIVLGAALTPEGEASPCMHRRVLKGCDLALKEKGADLLMSGGVTRKGIGLSEAEVMAEIAIKQGFSSQQLFIEGQSQNTLENAAFCKLQIMEKNWDDIWVVSDRYHLLRARLAFHAVGLKAHFIAAGGNNDSYHKQILACVREVPALIWYGFRILNGDPKRLLK